MIVGVNEQCRAVGGGEWVDASCVDAMGKFVAVDAVSWMVMR